MFYYDFEIGHTESFRNKCSFPAYFFAFLFVDGIPTQCTIECMHRTIFKKERESGGRDQRSQYCALRLQQPTRVVLLILQGYAY